MNQLSFALLFDVKWMMSESLICELGFVNVPKEQREPPDDLQMIAHGYRLIDSVDFAQRTVFFLDIARTKAYQCEISAILT